MGATSPLFFSYSIECKEVQNKFELEKQIEGYVNLLTELEDRIGDSEIALALLQEIAKDRRSLQIENRKAKANQNTEATPRQIAFLKRNNISFKEGISKKEASALIDKKFAEEKEV